MNYLDGLLARVKDIWASDGQVIILAVGAVVVLVGVFLAWRWFARGEAHKRTGTIAVALATAFASEGMWEVARESLHLDWYIALVLFAMFEIVMVNQAQTARYKLRLNPPGNARKHMTFVWLMAAASGVTASLNADDGVEFVLRLIAPSVAAGIWWTSLTADGIAKTPDAISWTLTPRRVLVRLGLAEPGERDVIAVDRERRIAAMTVTAHRLHHGAWFPGFRAARLRRLALAADDGMVAEVQRRVRRVHLIEALTAPDQVGRVGDLNDPSADQVDLTYDQADQVPDLVVPEPVQVATWSPLPEPRADRTEELYEAFGEPLDTPWALPDPNPDKTADHTSDQQEQGDQASDQNPDQVEEWPRPDADLIDLVRAECADLIASGRLSRYRVEQVTGANNRQARRVLAAVLGDPGQNGDPSDQTTDQADLKRDLVTT